jgi:hypothetical protein
MHLCLVCRASKHRRGKSAALHMAKSDVGGLRGAANTVCVLSQCVPHLRRAPRAGRPGSGCSLRAVTFNVGCPQIGTNACADGIGHALGGGGSASFSARSRAAFAQAWLLRSGVGLTLAFRWLAVSDRWCFPPFATRKGVFVASTPFGCKGRRGRGGERESCITGEMDGWRARVMRFARVSLRQCAVVTALAGFWQSRHKSRHQMRVLALSGYSE